MMRGEISIPVASLLAGIGMVAASVGAFYSAQLATSDRFAKNEVDIATIQNDVEHVGQQQDRLENKLDALLEKQNISPLKFNNMTPVSDSLTSP